MIGAWNSARFRPGMTVPLPPFGLSTIGSSPARTLASCPYSLAAATTWRE